MSVSESSKVQIDWLMKEFEANIVLFRMYQFMRGTLILGAVAGIGFLTKMYRESIGLVDFTKLEYSGVAHKTTGMIPEPFGMVLTSGIILLMIVWTIAGDTYLERRQAISSRRCAEIERIFLGIGKSFSDIDGLQKDEDVFMLGRGLLILLSRGWVITFGGAPFFVGK